MTIEIKKSSDVYTFIKRFHSDEYSMPTDACSLIRGFIFAFLFATIAYALAILAVVAIPATLVLFSTSLFYGGSILFPINSILPAFIVFAGAEVLLGITIGIIYGAEIFSNKFGNVIPKPKFTFVREVYRGWKEKYCPIVSYKD